MLRFQSLVTVLGVMLCCGLTTPVLAAKAKCGPDHAILYKRAVKLVDQTEKKLAAGYTAEAKSLLKEANALFTILQKECAPQEKERLLTDQEAQQEAINQKLAADELAQAEHLMKSADEITQKAAKIETTNPDLYKQYVRQAKGEYEQAQKRSIRSGIYALRNQQMVFKFLIR
jgi:hypothetical protein